MPSTYAHYKFGQDVKKSINGIEKNIVERYPELYNIGLHGPDILFYYNPLFSNHVNQIGYGMHSQKGKIFFQNAARVIKMSGGDERHLAYLYGYICHFALDVTCHGYIEEKIEKSGISHGEIEVEFDRQLMVMDGYNPIKHKLTDHIIADDQNACVIKDFYEKVSSRQIEKALLGMIKNNNLLLAPSIVKRSLIYGILRLTGNYKEMHGLIVNYKKNEACNDSTERLMDLYSKAQWLAFRLINGYKTYLSGLSELDPVYEYTFGSELVLDAKDN